MSKSWLTPILLVILLLPTTFSLWQPLLPSTHDGVTHVVRFAKFYQALSEGILVPRWADGIAFGLGSPVLMLNGYLPYLLTAVPRMLGFSLASSINILFGASLILSGLTFYWWASAVFGRWAGFVGAFLYVWAPYRLLDVYVRGAFPESVAFIFPPLMMLSAFKLSQKLDRRYFLLGVFSIAALILSHNVMAMIFVGVYILYLFMLRPKREYVKSLVLSLLLGFLISAFFWIPAFFEKGYTNLDRLNNDASYLTNFVPIQKIIYSKWGWGALDSDSPMSVQIGIAQQLVLFLTLIYVIIKRKNLRYPLLFGGLTLICLFLMTESSLFLWEHVSLLSFVLYPWRLLALITFSIAILASWFISLDHRMKYLIFLLLVIGLYSNRNYSQLVGKVEKNDDFYQNYTDTTDIWGEFLPKDVNISLINTCREKVPPCQFPLFLPRDSDVQVIGRFYYPGWQVKANGQVQPIRVNADGLIEVDLPQGDQKIDVSFVNTPLRNMAEMLTLLGLGGVLLLLWKPLSLKK